VGSYLSARQQHGRWLLRIDDLDPPRAMAGAADTILSQLERSGLRWDGEVMYQSSRTQAYGSALEHLSSLGSLFDCSCGRRALKASATKGIDGLVYPGTCRDADRAGIERLSRRFRIGDGDSGFDDSIRGPQHCDRATDLGDFILRRSDGLFSYPLAAAVDDHQQGITEVVRGADLLAGTHRQRILLDALGHPTPVYAHLPMVLDAAGEKLSKSEGAAALGDEDPRAELLYALRVLGQIAADEAVNPADFEDPESLLQWATTRWDGLTLHCGILGALGLL
jgi:glutamyl-Q tRNA(Asp) synthetase